MRRRDFIARLGAAIVWPSETRAQQGAPLVGYIRSTTIAGFANLETALRGGLKEAGFVEGQNVAVEYHYADNRTDRLSALINDLIRRQAAVIVGNAPTAIVAKAATKTVPIVFVSGGDPVRDGLVTSLNRPGGNVTGVTFLAANLGAKRLDLLSQLVPQATTIAMLVNPNTTLTEAERRDVLAAARAMGQQIVTSDASTERDIDAAFATFVKRKAGALLVGGGGFLNSQRDRLVALAEHHKLPASFIVRENVVAGGLMSYGPSQTDAYRQAGGYIARIIRGERPAELPVMQSTAFELVLNARAAKALGLTIPDRILALADEVIE